MCVVRCVLFVVSSVLRVACCSLCVVSLCFVCCVLVVAWCLSVTVCSLLFV